MNKNIRRSIVIAAGVTGAWALGSAVASADELPASSLSTSDATGDTASTLGSVTDAVTGTVDGVVTGVHHTASGAPGPAQAPAARATPPAPDPLGGAGETPPAGTAEQA